MATIFGSLGVYQNPVLLTKNTGKITSATFFFPLLLSSPSSSYTALCSCFRCLIRPLWIKSISLAVLFTNRVRDTLACVTRSDPDQIPTISSKYHHSPGKPEYKTRNNSRCCIGWKKTDLRSVGDSVTVLLIWFLVWGIFLSVRIWCKIHSSAKGPHGNNIYALLLFLACSVKCDATITNKGREFT